MGQGILQYIAVASVATLAGCAAVPALRDVPPPMPGQAVVAETDELIGLPEPLDAVQLYAANAEAVARTFGFSPDPGVAIRLGQVAAAADALPEAEAHQLRQMRPARSGLVTSYTYLYCYGAISPSAEAAAPLFIGAWARDADGGVVRVPINRPFYWLQLPVRLHMPYFVVDGEVAALQERCAQTLVQQLPPALAGRAEIRDVVARGRNNALGADHPLLPLVGAVGDGGLHTLVVFGDSLSDTDATSNMLLHLVPNRSSWYAGHFSNGWTWPEEAARALGVIAYNEAWGGAGTRSHPVLDWSVWQAVKQAWWLYYFPSLDEQWLLYQRFVALTAPRAPAETLYIVLVGANDLIHYHEQAPEIVARMTSFAVRLLQSGQVLKLAFATLPQISRAPRYIGARDDELRQLETAVRIVNDGLRQGVPQLQQRFPAAAVRLFDLAGIADPVLAEPGRYGFADARYACLENPDDNYLYASAQRVDCDGDNYLFWDHLHPARGLHRLIGRAFAQFVRSEFLPDTKIDGGIGELPYNSQR